MINVVMIKADSLTITFNTRTWLRAAERAVEMAGDWDGESSPLAKVFMSDGTQLEEHTIRQLKADLASGEISTTRIVQ